MIDFKKLKVGMKIKVIKEYRGAQVGQIRTIRTTDRYNPTIVDSWYITPADDNPSNMDGYFIRSYPDRFAMVHDKTKNLPNWW